VDERAPLLDVPLMTHSASTPALASASPAPAPQALSSGKNSDAMVATIRNLGMENAAMLKVHSTCFLYLVAIALIDYFSRPTKSSSFELLL
jgi:hypothetical protein